MFTLDELGQITLSFHDLSRGRDLIDQIDDPIFFWTELGHTFTQKLGEYQGNTLAKLFLSLLQQWQIGVFDINGFVGLWVDNTPPNNEINWLRRYLPHRPAPRYVNQDSGEK